MEVRSMLEILKSQRALPWMVLIAIAGVVLALAGGLLENETPLPASATAANTEQPSDMESRLARVLSAVEGAGEVEVLLARGEDMEAVPASAEAILGVIVVADGASSFEVRLNLQEAVKAATGLPASRIEILPRAAPTQP